MRVSRVTSSSVKEWKTTSAAAPLLSSRATQLLLLVRTPLCSRKAGKLKYQKSIIHRTVLECIKGVNTQCTSLFNSGFEGTTVCSEMSLKKCLHMSLGARKGDEQMAKSVKCLHHKSMRICVGQPRNPHKKPGIPHL